MDFYNGAVKKFFYLLLIPKIAPTKGIERLIMLIEPLGDGFHAFLSFRIDKNRIVIKYLPIHFTYCLLMKKKRGSGIHRVS